ncbi:alpha/beta hydrolase [Saliphagus sp. GCM10025334]
MSQPIVVPGARDVRATLEEPSSEPTAIVVACPPHPQHGGNRSDRRLVAVSDALVERGIACLRIDYGEWNEGHGEREDVRNAIRWASPRYDRVGVFGFSFGSGLALLASADDPAVDAVSALAPPSSLGQDLEVVPALASLDIPVQIGYGVRDTTVDWEPVVEAATERGDRVLEFSADHFFVGQHESVATEIGDFFAETLE